MLILSAVQLIQLEIQNIHQECASIFRTSICDFNLVITILTYVKKKVDTVIKFLFCKNCNIKNAVPWQFFMHKITPITAQF